MILYHHMVYYLSLIMMVRNTISSFIVSLIACGTLYGLDLMGDSVVKSILHSVSTQKCTCAHMCVYIYIYIYMWIYAKLHEQDVCVWVRWSVKTAA